MEQILLETTSSHGKEEKVTGSCQHRFINGKSCAARVPNFSCDEVTGTVKQWALYISTLARPMSVFRSFLLTRLVR